MKRSIILKIMLFVLVIVSNIYLINFNLRNKFKNITIELGTERVTIEDFLVSPLFLKQSECLTNINSIDISVVGVYDVEFVFNGTKESVKLTVEDTTPPEVAYIDLEKGLDYKFDPNDFVTLVHDKSDYTISCETEINELTIGNMYVDIAVTDEFNNKTISTRTLKISVFKESIEHELGEKLDKKEFLVTQEFGGNSITKEKLNLVDINKEGEYNLDLNYEGNDYNTKVVVKDTLGPKIVTKDINFYLGSTPKSNENFVKSVTDPSGVKDIRYEGELDYTKIGTYKLKIIATDNVGNVSESIATLNVKDDNVGPVFSGLSVIYANKNQEIDYNKGVQAKDAKDGIREYTVDTSKVNTSVAGTYYAVYSSSDTSNNITTKKRQIVISYDMEDLERMAREYYDKYLQGKSVLEMTNYIHDKNGYSHTKGNDLDALYQILTKKTGSCRGHAFLLEKALNYAGYKNMIIKTTDGTHYWNLVYENGVWRHYDSTGGHIRGPATDKEKLQSKGMHGRKWDTNLYPQAN